MFCVGGLGRSLHAKTCDRDLRGFEAEKLSPLKGPTFGGSH